MNESNQAKRMEEKKTIENFRHELFVASCLLCKLSYFDKTATGRQDHETWFERKSSVTTVSKGVDAKNFDINKH